MRIILAALAMVFAYTVVSAAHPHYTYTVVPAVSAHR